eukprot:GEMP01102914.1.p1 GENE.GEMP01102914.1~~GEMP01102914.1.p1  ORF type:complete len:164 (+),score=6.16 GEMP01102914.1:223-714(+)
MQNGVVSATPDAIRGPKKEILPQAMLREKDEVTILGIVDGIGSRVAAWLIFLGVNVRVFDSRAPKETLVHLVENDLRACYDMFETVKYMQRGSKKLNPLLNPLIYTVYTVYPIENPIDKPIDKPFDKPFDKPRDIYGIYTVYTQYTQYIQYIRIYSIYGYATH